MNPLISILRHGHCRSTHHYFAVDALDHLRTDAGRRFAKILLRYHSDYLRGAKDPDTRFRDFQNHVVHVNDGYWGGAPRVAHQWYDRLQKYLRTDKLKYAAHAAGVLSHYFTDPMMPLHTQQSSREKILHRPIEWSVTKSYREILDLWRSDRMRVVFEISDRPEWLGEAILHGARYSNQYYGPLLDTYDLGRGRRNPKTGLSLIAKQSLAELFGLAITGWARVLERTAVEAETSRGQSLPTPSVIASSLLLGARVPMGLIGKRISDRTERAEVESLISEFERTGDIHANLPAEVDIIERVGRIHASEREWLKRRRQLQSNETIVEVHVATDVEGLNDAASPSEPESNPATIPMPNRPAAFKHEVLGPRLSRIDLLERAPSIGPKTAARFAQIGIVTVEDFLAAPADEMSATLDTRWINQSIVELWQRQTTLMCEVPSLKVVDTQMIAGASCFTRKELLQTNAEILHVRITQYAATSAGRRYLRGGSAPNLTDVRNWIELAKRYEAQLLRTGMTGDFVDQKKAPRAA